MGPGGPNNGGGTYGAWGGRRDGWWGGGNRGDWQGRQLTPAEFDRMFREGRSELGQIERLLQQNDAEFARDIEALRRELRGLTNQAGSYAGNPELLNREQRALLEHIQQLELLLRRKIDEKQGAQVRATTDQPVPEGYRQAVAEYFRRLSREK